MSGPTSNLHELALRIAHDLGKYATLQARWLAPDAPFGEQVDAARADLLRTASGPDGTRDAASIAQPSIGPLRGGPWGADADVVQLVDALEALIRSVDGLRALGASPEDNPHHRQVVRASFAAAREVRAAAKALVVRTRPPEPDDDLL